MLAIDPLGAATLPLPPVQVVCRVPVGGRWRHGCRLARRLGEEELHGWLA
jgi:hypothetical protein